MCKTKKKTVVAICLLLMVPHCVAEELTRPHHRMRPVQPFYGGMAPAEAAETDAAEPKFSLDFSETPLPLNVVLETILLSKIRFKIYGDPDLTVSATILAETEELAIEQLAQQMEILAIKRGQKYVIYSQDAELDPALGNRLITYLYRCQKVGASAILSAISGTVVGATELPKPAAFEEKGGRGKKMSALPASGPESAEPLALREPTSPSATAGDVVPVGYVQRRAPGELVPLPKSWSIRDPERDFRDGGRRHGTAETCRV